MTPKLIVTDLIRHLLNEIERDPSVAPKFDRLSDVKAIWQSLLFCVLSSQVRATVAVRAVSCILSDVPFFQEKLSSVDVYHQTKRILQRRDVGYRFPEVRSRQVADSWFAFAQVKDDFYAYLDSFSAESEARLSVSARFPGLGLKQASMFLRDVGYSDRLCVIDTHILWYCSRVHSLPQSALTPRRYLEIEKYLLEASDAFGVSANIFDSAVWTAVKTFRSRQCTMQFA
jgi:N-glycosylase/DNA lyase